MAIKPGTLDDFSASMAEAIEQSLNTSLIADGLPGLPMEDTPERRDRRRLFVAIARGVIGHLKAQQASMVVHYDDDGVSRTTSVTLGTTGI
ncbi:hypothetical protein SAMN02745157_3307 [Kaistia soli DSM 19436]|uniref:Uncharacterized protein n=1 Tax=Kaistia soli DSM 19436 TaxID=1122133 RepID=A0A1M5G7G3_9HYPH|nr:hypothetical protein [Kaistia soli]SHF99685.1 hypothetical protein SAMN02745157_3307 [Kaistia soli DSM 19436]